MNQSQNKYKTFLRNYYLSSSLYDFIFAYAIYNLLFSTNGLSVFEISVLLTWWALTAMFFEIPSGALADYWSRKKLLIIAPLIKAGCFIIWFFAHGNFYLYALGFTFWSLGSALKSGTSEALLYDKLVTFKKENEYEKISGKKKFYFHISLAISMLIGGFMAHYNINLAIIFSIIPLLFSAFFATLISEPPKTKVMEEIKYFEYIKIAYQEVKSNKILLTLLIYSFGISIFGDIEEFDQLYYQLVNLPIFYFGVAGFVWSVLNALSSFYAYKFKKISWYYFVAPFLTSILLFLVGLKLSILMIILLLLSYSVTAPLSILIESKIQKNIQAVGRATIISTISLLVSFFAVWITPIFGIISKIWNLEAIYISTGIFLLIFSIWVFIKRKIFF